MRLPFKGCLFTDFRRFPTLDQAECRGVSSRSRKSLGYVLRMQSGEVNRSSPGFRYIVRALVGYVFRSEQVRKLRASADARQNRIAQTAPPTTQLRGNSRHLKS